MHGPIGTVLIAEELGAVRSLFALMLRDAGFDVIETGSCHEAVDVAVACRPHAILAACDSALDSLGLAERLASDPETRHIPVVLLAGTGQVDPLVLTDVSFVHTVLPRPCPREELIDHVGHAVAYSHELRQRSALPSSQAAVATVCQPRVRVAARPTEAAARAGELFPCPTCGESGLALLGETRHSMILRCVACTEVWVQRRP